MSKTLAVATALAIAVAGPAAWAHNFPPQRSVVVQVESCELVLMVGFRPSSGEASDALLARAAGQPKTQGLDALRAMLAQQAMAPLTVVLDGKPLVPTSVRTKIGAEPGGARPMVVLLVTYPLPAGSQLSVTSKDPKTTRVSWTDRQSSRVDLQRSASQGKWFDAVASFLLPLAPSIGGPACATSPTSQSSSRSR